MPDDTPIAATSNEVIESQLASALSQLEQLYEADLLVFKGPIADVVDDLLRDAVESISPKKEKLLFLLETDGGSINVAERIVTVLRHHYSEVDILVPNYAYSAGTILAMSGDSILMDYYSVLGPIDPQVNKAGVGWVPALGYLHKYEDLIEKSAQGLITQAEVAFLCERFDPAELHSFEQAREQSISLLKEWLVKWKFKDWTVTETNKIDVSQQMKEDRAAEIATMLNETQRWHSHSRGIPMRVLSEELNLKIQDFDSKDDTVEGLGNSVRSYYKLLRDYLMRLGNNAVIHVRDRFMPLGG